MMRRLNRDLRAFRAMTGSERLWLVQAMLLLPLTAASLRLLGFRRLRALLSRKVSADKTAQDAGALAKALGMERAIRIAARRGFFRATCLHRSILLWWGLRRRGIPGELKIGICSGEGLFEAHAWVECRGIALEGAADAHRRFAAFDGDVITAADC